MRYNEAMTADLVPRPLYSRPDKYVVVLSCGHFRVISCREFDVYPEDLDGIGFFCIWCHRTTMLDAAQCWGTALRSFPAPPGASITA